MDFDTPNARNASGRGGRTAAFKFYEIPDNLDDPIDRATSLDNQGNGLFDRYELDRRREDIEAAISASREAISLLPEADAGRARTLRNLGVALLACYRDTHDAGALGQAFDAFAQGLTVVSEDSDQYPLLLACLADAHLQRAAIDPDAEGSLDAALGLFDQAESLLGSRSQAPIPYALGASAIGGTVHAHVGALIWLANGQEDGERETTLRRALAVAEAAKTRELAGEIARIALAAPPEIPEGATWMEQYLLAELGRLDAQELARVGDYRPDELRLTRMAYRSRLLRQLDGVWDEIADVSDAAAAYVADRRGGTGQWDRALDVADPDTAYVSLSTAIDLPADVAASNPRPRKLVALAVRGGPAAPVVVIERRPDPTPDAVRRFGAEIPVDRGLGLFRESWDRDLVELLRELREGIGPVQRVAISPPANGRALPWALALERAGWCDPDGAALGVRTLPTLAVMRSDAPTLVGGTRWHAVRDAARSFGLDDPDGLGEAIGFVRPVPTGPAQGPPLVVGDPRADLPEAVREAVDVANILHVKPLLGPAATVGAVRTALAQASIVHLAAHARFTTTSPLDSPVLLADGELTARDLAGEFSANELIVMSACESGTGGRLVGDEVAGIAHVLLRAGARAVLASLWPVDDASTAALMTKFHSLRAAGADLATALATAAAAVRQHSQWQHPYYWAGFVLVEVS